MCVYVFVSVYMCGCVVVIFKTSWTSSGWANWSGSVLGFGSVQECGLGQMERSFWSCNVYVCEPIMPYYLCNKAKFVLCARLSIKL